MQVRHLPCLNREKPRQHESPPRYARTRELPRALSWLPLQDAHDVQDALYDSSVRYVEPLAGRSVPPVTPLVVRASSLNPEAVDVRENGPLHAVTENGPPPAAQPPSKELAIATVGLEVRKKAPKAAGATQPSSGSLAPPIGAPADAPLADGEAAEHRSAAAAHVATMVAQPPRDETRQLAAAFSAGDVADPPPSQRLRHRIPDPHANRRRRGTTPDERLEAARVKAKFALIGRCRRQRREAVEELARRVMATSEAQSASDAQQAIVEVVEAKRLVNEIQASRCYLSLARRHECWR